MSIIKGNVACEISTLLIPFVGIKIQFVSSISSHLLLRNEKMYYTALCVYCSLIRKKIYDNFYLVRGSRIPLQASFPRIRSEVCKNINLTFLTNQTQKDSLCSTHTAAMTIYVKHGFPLRSTQWEIFCGKKLGKLDHKKRPGLGRPPPGVSIDAEFGDHFSHDLSLKRDKPICLFLTYLLTFQI